jgi:hypothetical protein
MSTGARSRWPAAQPPVCCVAVSLFRAMSGWSAPGRGPKTLLTLRAQRAMMEADAIVYDALVPEAVVALGRRDAERIRSASARVVIPRARTISTIADPVGE